MRQLIVDKVKPTTTASSPPRCRLYLITPPSAQPAEFLPQFEEALAAGDIACLQIRLKNPDMTPCPDDRLAEMARTCLPLAHRHDVAVLINDRPTLAAALHADGVHIGQQDADCRQLRRQLGREFIIGVTCHNSRHLAMCAGEDGADYIAFGSFYPSATKAATYTADKTLLTWWQQNFALPCVAIGGITLANAAPLIAAGADFLAVCQGVWNHPQGITAAIQGFDALFATPDTKIPSA